MKMKMNADSKSFTIKQAIVDLVAQGHKKELILFAVFCARQNEHLLKDMRSVTAINATERYAHGMATKEEIKLVRNAAYAAWAAAANAAANAAAAAYADAWTAANAAADAAANVKKAQIDYLKSLFNYFFDKT